MKIQVFFLSAQPRIQNQPEKTSSSFSGFNTLTFKIQNHGSQRSHDFRAELQVPQVAVDGETMPAQVPSVFHQRVEYLGVLALDLWETGEKVILEFKHLN